MLNCCPLPIATRISSLLIVIGLFGSSSCLTAMAANNPDDQPNILFIFADDLSYDSIHASGNDEVQTPNLDRLARQSTYFTHAYNMGAWNGAVCLASRAMLNSGRFVWHANKLNLKTEQAAGRTWSQQMKSAGYETYFTGKWHVPLDPKDIFDHVGHVRGGMPNQTPEGYNRPVEGDADAWSPFDKSKGGFWKGGKHWSEVVGDDTIEFLDKAKHSELPFFMYIAFNAPHDPRQSPQEFVEKYPIDSISVPPTFQPEYPYKEAIGAGKSLRDEKLAPFPRTEYSVKVNRQEYYAIISHMDQQIGRILDSLEASGKSDNTYVFFTADHGLAVGHHGLIGKQNMYEHSVRVPFFVRGPNVPSGQQIPTRIYLQDVMPTTMALAGIENPEFVHFKNLLPMIKGATTRHYDSIYSGYRDLQRMVIKGDHKLIVYPAIKKRLLFNLDDDPLEMNDLAQAPGQQAMVQGLFEELQKLQELTGDEMDLKTVFQDP